MICSDIQRLLLGYFDSHKYQLLNSYVFNWECDFFSMAKSGYAYEVEIKVSRSDFLADFKKPKHKMFINVMNGQKGHWRDMGKSWYVSIICTVEYKHMIDWVRSYKAKSFPGVDYDFNKKMFVTNQWDKYDLHYASTVVRAQATSIHYVDYSKTNFPNRFYYCTPKDLIKKEEVPAYAGLYYASSSGIELIKKAPLITNRIMHLTPVLLEKFYYECVRLRTELSYEKSKKQN